MKPKLLLISKRCQADRSTLISHQPRICQVHSFKRGGSASVMALRGGFQQHFGRMLPPLVVYDMKHHSDVDVCVAVLLWIAYTHRMEWQKSHMGGITNWLGWRRALTNKGVTRGKVFARNFVPTWYWVSSISKGCPMAFQHPWFFVLSRFWSSWNAASSIFTFVSFERPLFDSFQASLYFLE